MRKPQTFEYVDYKLFDGQPLTCEFEVDMGYPETRDEPGDPGGLYLMSAKLNDSDITELLKDKAVEVLTQDATSAWNEECNEDADWEKEYAQSILDDKWSKL